jgi:hypothetical protein
MSLNALRDVELERRRRMPSMLISQVPCVIGCRLMVLLLLLEHMEYFCFRLGPTA